MKIIITVATLFTFTFKLFAADTTIVFKPLEYKEVFELAKKKNKGVMLYFHFDGCGACRKMEKTVFKDRQVFEYYNSNFINFEINTLKGVGLEINKTYNVRMHPTFLFFDKNGNELHKLVGAYTAESFLQQAHNALNSDKTISNYKKSYQNGQRDSEFLFDYCYMLRDGYELDSMVINEYLSTIEPSEYEQEKNIKFIYEYVIYNHKNYISFDNPAFTFLESNKDKFYEYFDKDQVDSRIVWALHKTLNQAIEENDAEIFSAAMKIAKPYDQGKKYLFKEMDGRLTGIMNEHFTLFLEMALYEKNKNVSKYKTAVDQYISIIWDEESQLNSFAWSTFEQSEDVDKLKTAVKCSVRSIELNNDYANNDTYAWLLFKLGEHEKALKQAEKTIQIAKKNNEDYSETAKIITELSNK
ncbi:MAG: thioredoxin fold domain-containing protein [Saprospiraceae bacterium]|nr:thioredoxin fold domain-containing protein [Saprospiraceae bacterium]